MKHRLSGLLCLFLILMHVAYGQDQTIRLWSDVRDLKPAQVGMQIPVIMEGTVVFCDPLHQFFVVGEGSEGVPVQVLGTFPELMTGQRVRVTGTTKSMMNASGIRMVTVESLARGPESAATDIPPPAFLKSDPPFKYVTVEGLITSMVESRNDILLGFCLNAQEAYYLRVSDSIFSDTSPEDYIGQWVSLTGLYLPEDSGVIEFPGRSGFCLASTDAIKPIQDWVAGDPVPLTTIAASGAGDTVSPVMIEGVINRTDVGWLLNDSATSIALDWNHNEIQSGTKARCVGFPVMRSDRLTMTRPTVFIPDTISDQEKRVLRGGMYWEAHSSQFPDTLMSIAHILNMTPSVADQRVPVDLEAIVTYHQPGWSLFFVQDQTGSLFVHMTTPLPNYISGGTRIRIRGYTQKGFHQNVILSGDIDIVRQESFPESVACDLAMLKTGDFDCRFVEVTGQVRRSALVDRSLQLHLQTKNGPFTAYLRENPKQQDPSRWVDSVVKLTGVCGYEWIEDRPVGVLVYVDTEKNLQMIEPGKAPDVLSENDVLHPSAWTPETEDYPSRVLLQGYVTGQPKDGVYTFQTSQQGFRVQPVDSEQEINFEQPVRVMGWPRLDGTSALIEDAEIMAVEASQAGEVPHLQAAADFHADNLDRLIERAGRLISLKSQPDQLTFILQSDSERFTATVQEANLLAFDPSEFELGSQLKVQGVLVSFPEDQGYGEVPSLMLRHRKDVVLLQKPSWWTTERILTALGISGGVGFSAFLWVFLLKQKIRQQTVRIGEVHLNERQAVEKFHNLFESAMDVIFITDTQGRLVTVNASGLDYFGKSMEAIEGQSILDWIAEADLEQARRAFGFSSQREPTEEGNVVELRLRNGEGRFTYVELCVRGLSLQEGVFGYQAIARNVDARKQSELALIKSRDAHREANEAKSDFLTMMSHDLRTPMNGVLGMTQLLLNTRLDQEQRDQVRTIASASQGMMKLMLDLLDISHMEAGLWSITEENVDLVPLVEEVVATLAAEVDRKKLDLVLVFQPGMRRQVMTDSARLRQVLLNLVGNAIKFTDQGGISLRAFEGTKTDHHSFIRFEIEDSGVGLKGEDREQLFEVLARSESPEPRRFGGAGLGLTICKRIVQAMGGAINASTTARGGTLFWFELPIEVAADSAWIDSPTMESEGMTRGVLLVTDSPFVMEYFSRRMAESAMPLNVITVDLLKEYLTSGKVWNGNPFHSLVLDGYRLPHNQLISLIDSADEFWKTEVQWVLLDALDQPAIVRSTPPLAKEPYRWTKPLTETGYHQFCHFVTDAGKKQTPSTSLESQLNTAESVEVLKTTRLRVLVAEDDPINQKLILLYLKNIGCIGRVAPDGHEALNLLDQETFDVVLMDCNMPIVDGLEATRRIRSDGRFKDLIIIATTANAIKGYREQCFDAGMDDYLVKPLNLDLLTLKLARVAKRCEGASLSSSEAAS